MPFQLPDLPYPYDALEPYCDEVTVRLHHDVHHKAYVDELNKTEGKLAEARAKGDFTLIKHRERVITLNLRCLGTRLLPQIPKQACKLG